MGMSSAEKQAAFRKRRAEAGLVFFQVWVSTEKAAQLAALLKSGEEPRPELAVTSNLGLNAEEREKYRLAAVKNDYLASEVKRLHLENDRLVLEVRHESRMHAITLKKLISGE